MESLELILHSTNHSDRALMQIASQAAGADGTAEDTTIWTRQAIAKLSISLRYQLCKQLFQDLPAEFAKKLVESTQTAEEHLSAKVYGEIEFSSFFSILQSCEPKQGDVIVDLGHGTGKALIASLVLYGSVFSRIHGIDIVPEIVEESQRRILKVQQLLDENDTYAPFLQNCLDSRSLHEVVTVEIGDMLSEDLQYDWTQADIVFANSTCFGFDLMGKLSQKASRLRAGAKLITMTLPVQSNEFELVLKRNYPMSWGVGTMYFQVKKATI